MSEYFFNIDKLAHIEALPQNWNGNDADSFSHRTCENARNLLLYVDEQPDITPTSIGTIHFIFRGKDDKYSEIEVHDTYFSCIYTLDGKQMKYKKFDLDDYRGINDVLSKISQ